MSIKNTVFVPARCDKTKKDFYIRTDLNAEGKWVFTYGLKELPEQETLYSDGAAELQELDLSNGIKTGPQYKCPYCGNTDFVRCGRCQKQTCLAHGRTDFHCAHCDIIGTLNGGIPSISGIESEGQGK